jgi:general secretion pathway protein I
MKPASPASTLIEVLVALAIIAVEGLYTSALTTSTRCASPMLLAHLCAENELAKNAPAVPDAQRATATINFCEIRRLLVVTLMVRPTPNPEFRRVDAQCDGAVSAPSTVA